MHFLVLIYRDTTTIVLYGDRVIFVDSYLNVSTIASHRLVDRVVDGFVYQMVETLLADVANVHSRTLTYSFQTLEYLNVTRGVVLFLVQLFFCHYFNSSIFRFSKFTILVAKVQKKVQINVVYLLKIQKNKAATLSGHGFVLSMGGKIIPAD